jgi:hypothetical protein
MSTVNKMEAALAIASAFLVVADATDEYGQRARTDVTDKGEKLNGLRYTVHVGQMVGLLSSLLMMTGDNPLVIAGMLKMLQDDEAPEQFKALADAMDDSLKNTRKNMNVH